MIYFDNAATSGFKPKCLFDTLKYDIDHSANSGRSGHRFALDAALRIENARAFFAGNLGCDGNIVFTKSCTEALNLALLGFLKPKMRVITTAYEHNSVLRPLETLRKHGIIEYFVVNPVPDGRILPEHMARAAEGADLCVVTMASNVTGETPNIAEISRSVHAQGAKLLVDGAQGVPILDINMKKLGVDMLALPGHKGLHGIQGTGLLAIRDGILLTPLIYGGTGTNSQSLSQPADIPDGLEAGTLFSGGISALHACARYTFENIAPYRQNVKTLTKELLHYLKAMRVNVYTKNPTVGVVSFNIGELDSAYVANKLDEAGFAVRSGLHCAPLTHRYLGTSKQGAVRVSIGIDNTQKEVFALLSEIEKLLV